MQVDFVEFNSKQDVTNVIAGKYDSSNRKIILLNFYFNNLTIDSNEFGRFSEKVMDYKNAKLNISNNEYIKYNYAKSSVTFKTNNIFVTLSQNFAPECLKEALSEFFT